MAEETRTDDGSSSSTQPVLDSPPNPQEPVSGSQVPPSSSLGNDLIQIPEGNRYGPGLYAILNDPMHIPEGNTYGPGLYAILNDPMRIPEGNTYGPGLYAILNDPLGESVTFLPLRYNIPTTESSEGAGNEQEQAESSEGAGNEQEQEQKEQHDEEAIVRNPFNLNVILICQLAILVLFLIQEESTNTLFLIFCASLVYLYKRRLVDYFIRRLHQLGAHYLPENDPPPLDDVDGLNAGVDNLNQNQPGENQEQPNADVDNLNPNQPGENQEQPNAGVDNLNPNEPAENQEQPKANENNQQVEQRNNLVMLMREIQMHVVAFLISLLPEVGNND